MRYLDANVFVYAALDSGKKGESARSLLRKIILNESAATSCLTIDEVVWAIQKHSNRNEAIKQAQLLFELANLAITPLTRDDSYRSLAYMRKYPHLKPRGALQLAVATRLGAKTIVSDDYDFDKVGELKREKLE